MIYKYKTKEEALKAVKQCGLDLEFVNAKDFSLEDYKEIVFAAMENDLESICYASENLKKDKIFMLELAGKLYIDTTYFEEDEVLKKWLDDEDFILTGIKNENLSFNCVSDRLYHDKKFILKLLANDCNMEYYANLFPKEIWKDFTFAYIWAKKTDEYDALYDICLDNNFNPINYFGVKYIYDINILRKLCVFLRKIYGDPEFVIEEELLLTSKFNALQLVKEKADNIGFFDLKLQKDYVIVMEALKRDGRALKFASEELRDNYGIVMEAVKQNGFALNFASEELQKDSLIVLEAVKNGFPFEKVPEELRNNYEIVMEAVKKHCLALAYASEELRNNYEIVIEAVKRDGRALRFASEELRNNYEIVMEAVKQDGRALEYASEELQKNYDFVKFSGQHKIEGKIYYLNNMGIDKNSTYDDILKVLEITDENI